MPDPIRSDLSSSSKQLIKETVSAVIKELTESNPFAQSILNTRQAARYLNTSPSFLIRLRSRCKGPHYIQFESAIRYRLTDIDAWLTEKVTKPSRGS